MAIDPDVQALLDGVYARLADLEDNSPGGSGFLGVANGPADATATVSLLDMLGATVDDEDSRLGNRLNAVDLALLPQFPLPSGPEGPEGPPGPAGPPGSGGGAGPFPDVGNRYVAKTGSDSNDGLSWGSAKLTLKAACEDLNSAGKVFVGKGRFDEVGQIPWKQGMIIVGTSPGSTDVRLLPTGTPPLFVSDPSLPNTEFLHWAGMRDIKIRGSESGPQSSVIEFNCRIGESTRISNVVIHTAGGDGIHAKRGGQPVFWQDLHIFGGSTLGRTGGYGLNLERTGGDVWNSVTLYGISGDNNEAGLIRFSSGGSGDRTKEQLSIVGLKAESNGLRQRDAVVLDGTHLAVSIIGAATQGGSLGGNSLVKILGLGNPPVLLQNIATGYDHIIDDQVAGVTIDRVAGPGGEAVAFLFYNKGIEVMRLGSGS